MCDPISAGLAITSLAISATSMVEQNQQIQQQKGAQEAAATQQRARQEELAKAGPTPTVETLDNNAEAERQKRIRALRSGMASTIKTSGSGVSDKPLVAAPMAGGTNLKMKLGA